MKHSILSLAIASVALGSFPSAQAAVETVIVDVVINVEANRRKPVPAKP